MTDASRLTNQKSPLKRLKCHLGWCGCLPKHDAKGCWAECIECGRTSAFVHHEVLASYSALQEAHKKHLDLVASLSDPSEYSGAKVKE